MQQIPPLLVLVGSMTGILLGMLIMWQLFVALIRLVLATHSPAAVSLLLTRLAAAVREGAAWEPVLRSLRLELPWPWPWRLKRAATWIAEGVPPAEVLGNSGLLPACLRDQAAQALRQGQTAFVQWCAAVAEHRPGNALAVRQQAFLLAECVAIAWVMWFLATFILPKFEFILRDLQVQAPPLLALMIAVVPYTAYAIWVVICVAIGVWSVVATLAWRRRRRFAAARLILVGSVARLPESALGSADGFAAVCAAAGWRAHTPAELSRQLASAVERDALRGAWMPAVFASLAPVIAAIPIAAVVIGIMQVLTTILTSVEAGS